MVTGHIIQQKYINLDKLELVAQLSFHNTYATRICPKLNKLRFDSVEWLRFFGSQLQAKLIPNDKKLKVFMNYLPAFYPLQVNNQYQSKPANPLLLLLYNS